jgi:penicillin-binding protein 1A
MEKVMADNSLVKYRAKFPAPKQPITKQYHCSSAFYEPSDSLDIDSISFSPASSDEILQDVHEDLKNDIEH